jgi:hypothetical protein
MSSRVSAPTLAKPIISIASRLTSTPPASAKSRSPPASAPAAVATAIIPEAHAPSTV